MAADRISEAPLPLVLLMCDGMHRDPGSGKLSFLGLFGSITATSFPYTHSVIVVYLAFTDACGKVPIRVQIVDAEEERPPICATEAVVTMNDPRAVADMVVSLNKVKFPLPGEYRLQVFASQQFMIERRLNVRLVAARDQL